MTSWALERRLAHGHVALVAIGALVGLAWGALWVWQRSPHGRFLGHDTMAHAGPAEAGLFVAGWTLMTIAMMLPTTLPLVATFQRLTNRRENRGVLLGLLLTGYLGVWATFGVVAHGADRAVHGIVEHSEWFSGREWLVGAATVGGAGVYQFTSLKYRCLDACRSPLLFLTQRWAVADRPTGSLQIGAEHGLFCLGCCWSLMLVMFAVGVGNLGWMLLLAAVMAAEKTAPWGRRLSAPLGWFLILCSAGIIIGGVS